MADADGEWQLVRKRGKKARTRRAYVCETPDPGGTTNISKIQKRLKEDMGELTCEDFWGEWKDLLSSCFTQKTLDPFTGDSALQEECLDCVCYGLGSFLSSVTSRYQLAMLILLLDMLKVPAGRCSVYDPVFSTDEHDVLRHLGITVLTDNEEGKRAITKPTLFYLIHCGTALYNNLLWSNWSPKALALMTIVGNSFHSFQQRIVKQHLERDYRYIADVIPACQETPLPCSSHFMDVFNDTALLRFPQQKLSTLPPQTWSHAVEPCYVHCTDLEIIQRNQTNMNTDKDD